MICYITQTEVCVAFSAYAIFSKRHIRLRKKMWTYTSFRSNPNCRCSLFFSQSTVYLSLIFKTSWTGQSLEYLFCIPNFLTAY